VLVERFDSVTLESVSAAFASDSELIRVRSFSQQPNPGLSAYALMHYDASEALPAVSLSSLFDNRTTTWTPLPNLLQAGPADANFVVEVEYDGTARLRFGDNTTASDRTARRPSPQPTAWATAAQATSARRAGLSGGE